MKIKINRDSPLRAVTHKKVIKIRFEDGEMKLYYKSSKLIKYLAVRNYLDRIEIENE